MPRLRAFGRRTRANVQFVLVYITEAHASDSWPMKFAVEWPRPRSLAQRQAYARTCADELRVGFEVVVDGMDDAFNAAFRAWPTAYYVIDADARLLYVGTGTDDRPDYASYDVGELFAFLRRLTEAVH